MKFRILYIFLIISFISFSQQKKQNILFIGVDDLRPLINLIIDLSAPPNFGYGWNINNLIFFDFIQINTIKIVFMNFYYHKSLFLKFEGLKFLLNFAGLLLKKKGFFSIMFSSILIFVKWKK